MTDAIPRRTSALVQRFKQVAVDRASLERRRFDLAEVVQDADPRLRKGVPVDGVELVLELEAGRVVGCVAVDLPFPREATDPAVVELRRRILARLVGEPQSEPRRKP